ncbi:MAG: hypothetical protein JXR03_06570 [Cyclobacteriaceae bacterium]
MIDLDEEILHKLDSFCENQINNSIIFGFDYESLSIKCIYFQKVKIILIAFADRSVAWQIEISNHKISEQIPNEAYIVIKDVLRKGEKYSNRPFFNSLIQKIETLEKHNIQGANDDEILNVLKQTCTKDKKYDKDGDNPYFNHWRRVPPSLDSLNKIQRYFGWKIREDCRRNKVTAVFKDVASSNSLDFLNPNSQQEEISKMGMTKKAP